ncbi:MAG: type II toxin-antitoxin system RelE/ParE family toxin [Acidobacteria bacterium]|nr:type II toxin-antitoxin system RelE/ParE family toxin [Acidobacteriota bacterium]
MAAEMRVRFHPAARAEVLDAFLWYEERSPLTAAAFRQEIASAISLIAETPNRYPRAEHAIRRLVLPRFPFNVFYRTGQDGVVIGPLPTRSAARAIGRAGRPEVQSGFHTSRCQPRGDG